MIPPGPTASATGKDGLFDRGLRARIGHAARTVHAALLAERNARGAWTGELSSSALSTATATAALSVHLRSPVLDVARDHLRALVRAGNAWLVANQNVDGGWGDTAESPSNLSTTALGWAALGLEADAGPQVGRAVVLAERWLTRAAGSIEPARLVRAIEDSYGEDRTFSIPILTLCALAGRLGAGREAWRHVRQLPFEVAALPQRWFAALKLPVVSYALPALIAIGQVRHGLRPTGNWPLRWLRHAARRRTLEKLVQLQPENGGFLEATPLTSFVVMSLAALGLNDHLVVQRGVEFLRKSVRPDGSWPIDTNLATWVTTLAVNALVPAGGGGSAGPRDRGPDSRAAWEGDVTLSAAERAPIADWLLQQQYRQTHPYTLAAPGGWAWTDLPGGVPDADDTAGALLALPRLGPAVACTVAAASAGVAWLLELQNRDGGIPTFCRGWGKLPFDRSSPDLTAHAVRAWLAWRPRLDPPLRLRVDAALKCATAFLCGSQAADGAWVPLWFGHQAHPAGENPVYGTARVILALCETEVAESAAVTDALNRGLQWLFARQNDDGGWTAAPGAASSVEETAVALEAIAVAWERNRISADARAVMRGALERGADWIVAAVERDRWRKPSPIGLYFAKLWYHERLYPVIFATAALQRLARMN